MDYLKEISQSLDTILDTPAEQWTQKEINLYHLLGNTLDKYKLRYSLAQFKLDLKDIRTNVHAQGWYDKSSYKKTLDWCLDQMAIKSFQKSKKTGNFKVQVKFTQVQVLMTVIFRDENFFISLKSPLFETDLKDLNRVAQVFGVDERVDDAHRKHVALDLVKMIEEIALFYT